MLINRLLSHLNHKNSCLLPRLPRHCWGLPTLSWIILICLTVFFTRSLLAQEAADAIIEYSETREGNDPNLENWTSANTDSTILKFLDITTGVKNISEAAQNPDASFIPGGMLATTNNIIAQLYTPPASGIDYIASLKNNLLSKPAYAQGAGFTGLAPLLPIWRGFRNVIYILSSLFFVILGLMVMLRVKTGPQTIVTIQNAIPKIITTLILVTFSYAIAGLLIDLMNLLQALFLSALFVSSGNSLTSNLFPNTISRFTEWLSQVTGANLNINVTSYDFAHLSSADRWQTLKLLNLALPQGMILLISALIGGVTGAILLSPLPALGPVSGFAIGTAVILLIIQLIILIQLIKFVIGLAKTYLNVILKIILAPLEIGIGSFPGIKIGFSSWLTGLIANLSVFPISFLFLVLLNLIIAQIRASSGLWAPGMLTGVAGITRAVLGFSGIMLISKLPELIPQVVFQLKPSPLSQAIGDSTKNIPIISGVYKTASSGIEKTAGQEIGAETLYGFSKAFPGYFRRKRTQAETAKKLSQQTETPTQPPAEGEDEVT